MATPAVPGAINITDLTGNEVVPLQSGAGSTQTTTQNIANLAGGGGQTGPTGPTGSGATGATGPTGSGGGSGAPVLSTGRITFTSSQILNSNVTPIPILDAPGAGKCIIVTASIYESIFGTTAYTFADSFALYYGAPTSSNVQADQSGIASFSGVSVGTVSGTIGGLSAFGLAESAIVNQPLVLAADVSNPTDGDLSGAITVLYTVVTL